MQNMTVMKQRERIVLCKCHIFFVSAVLAFFSFSFNILPTCLWDCTILNEWNRRAKVFLFHFLIIHPSFYNRLYLADYIWLSLVFILLKYKIEDSDFHEAGNINPRAHTTLSTHPLSLSKHYLNVHWFHWFPMATAANNYVTEKKQPKMMKKNF